MELVNGLPLTRFCDEARLSPQERLELFVPICQAVQHAHQKGIVHRDLKPANILVTLIDGNGVPKVIDFGVVKAIAGKITDASMSTQFGAMVGTLEYMAPEQAGFSGDDVDTRADIYSLGVILYELLTGLRPINARRLEKAALTEMIRIIREEEPSKPSTRLSTDDSLPSLAAVRRTEPRRLTAMLRGELDWVVMKCLEKARERRYESASGLARDIQRYLADEPVEARPPSAAYRLAKLLKRHRTATIAASLVLVALLVGIAGMTYGLVRAEIQRKKAEQAQAAEAEQRARAETQLEKALAAERQTGIERDKALAAEAKARAINDFLTQDLLYQNAPEFNAVGSNVTLREVLDRAAANVGTRFAGQPGIEMALRITIARTYLGLGALDKAEAAWRSMLESARRRDPDAAETFIAQGELAHTMRERGRRDAEVLKMAEAAAQAVERKLGPNNSDAENMLSYLAVMYEDLGRFDEAIALFERVRDTRGARMGLDHIIMLQPLQNLGHAYVLAGKLPEAIALLKQVYDAEVKLGPDHSLTITTANNLAVALSQAGKAAEAVALLEPVRDTATAMLGPDHPLTLHTLNNLAANYDLVGKVRDAIAMLERARDASTAKLGLDHPLTLTTRYNLARAYQADGKLREAIELLKQVLDARVAKQGPDHPETLTTRLSLAVAYYFANQLDRSVPLFEDGLKRTEARFGRAHVETQRVVANLGVNYRAAGRLADAIPLLEEAYNSGAAGSRLGRHRALRCLCEGRPVERGGEALQSTAAPRPGGKSQRKPATRGHPGGVLSLADERQGVCRGRVAPPRMPGNPREEPARSLENLQLQVDARRRPARPEKVRRGRAAAARRLPGDEAARSNDPARGESPVAPGRRATRAVLRDRQQARRGVPMAQRTRPEQAAREETRREEALTGFPRA